jgi:hypothetical protein
MAGFGLTGDTITASGTLAVDTTIFHTSAYNNVTFAAISHTHSASDIISGTLPIVRGGTGLSGIGYPGQYLRVTASGTSLEYFYPTLGDADSLGGHPASYYATVTNLALKKDNTDSSNSISGYTTLYQNGLKASISYVDSLNNANGVNDLSNHIISGGMVTYSGSGYTYYVSACTYVIGGVLYNSRDTSITLSAADATNPRIDLFAVDTLSEALKITGTAATTPIAPQVDPASQLALTTGITLPPGSTTPSGTTSTLIYDENTEWTTGGTATVDFNNTAQPYHGTKDAYVSSYSKGSTLTFTTTTQTVDNSKTLRAFIRLNNSNYSFQFQFFNGTTAVSNIITASVNNSLFGSYQNVSIPLSSFTWSGTAYDKIIISMTGHGATGTYYLDYMSLEGGTPVIPPVDYSNKVDSVSRIAGSYYYWVKGVKHLISLATDSSAYHTIGQASDYFTLNTLNGRKDTVSFPKDTQYVKNPLYSDNDTLKFHSDSLTSVLKYSGIDSSAYDDNTLIPKGYLNNRIAEVTATGITRSELKDTAIAIRSAIPLQFNPIAGTNVTLSGTYPNITFNSTASGGNDSAYVNIDTTADGKFFTFRRINGGIDTLGLKGTDTSNLRNDINTNTTNINLKADKATTLSINGIAYDLSAPRSWTISSSGDTAFIVLTALNLKTTIPVNKGLLLRDTTLGTGAQNSPPVLWQGRNNGATALFAAYVDGSSSQGSFKIAISKDSGLTWTTLMTIDKGGNLSMPGNATFSSYVSAAQFAGSLLNIVATTGTGVFGANRTINSFAQLELTSTSRGFLNARFTSDQRKTLTGNVAAGTITSGGSGYTNGTYGVSMGGGSGTGQIANFTISGGVVTSVSNFTLGEDYQVGDVLTYASPVGGVGSGFSFTVTAVKGTGTSGVSVYDSTINAPTTWNGVNWQNGFITGPGDQKLRYGTDYVFTGATATYTLPSVTSNILGRTNMIMIKNRGTGAITLNSDSGNTIYTGSATGTITIAAGSAAALMPDGTYFNVMYNN